MKRPKISKAEREANTRQADERRERDGVTACEFCFRTMPRVVADPRDVAKHGPITMIQICDACCAEHTTRTEHANPECCS